MNLFNTHLLLVAKLIGWLTLIDEPNINARNIYILQKIIEI
jgi:hypothetical protein